MESLCTVMVINIKMNSPKVKGWLSQSKFTKTRRKGRYQHRALTIQRTLIKSLTFQNQTCPRTFFTKIPNMRQNKLQVSSTNLNKLMFSPGLAPWWPSTTPSLPKKSRKGTNVTKLENRRTLTWALTKTKMLLKRLKHIHWNKKVIPSLKLSPKLSLRQQWEMPKESHLLESTLFHWWLTRSCLLVQHL